MAVEVRSKRAVERFGARSCTSRLNQLHTARPQRPLQGRPKRAWPERDGVTPVGGLHYQAPDRRRMPSRCGCSNTPPGSERSRPRASVPLSRSSAIELPPLVPARSRSPRPASNSTLSFEGPEVRRSEWQSPNTEPCARPRFGRMFDHPRLPGRPATSGVPTDGVAMESSKGL